MRSPDKRAAFTGLYVKEIDHDIRLAVKLYFQSFSKITG